MSSPNLNSPKISIQQLEEAFAAFNQVSADLGSNYRELEGQVSNLNRELAASHSARMRELTEKGKLAAKLSALMDALPGGVLILDADGKIKEENPVARLLLGASFQGQYWLQALKLSAPDQFNAPNGLEGEITLSNGNRVSIKSSTYGDEGNTIILLTDVSENHRLNELVNREKRLSALGEMAARLAHQVRTPLSSAILYLSHLPQSDDNENPKPIASKILSRLRQIERLIEGMLSYIRGETGEYRYFSLNQLLADVKDSFSEQLETTRGHIELNCTGCECVINGDREALFNAISNLVDNAILAVDTQPIICMSLICEGDRYLISVEDNGPGIDESIRELVFDPFFSTRPMGTGLGLAVVMSVISAIGGTVTVKSNPTEGAQFMISLPRDLGSINEEFGIWQLIPKRAIAEEKSNTLNRRVRP